MTPITQAKGFNIPETWVKKMMFKDILFNPDFSWHQLNVGNEITLGELVNNFITDNNWNAKDYNVLTHNCQDFVAKCIKILKLTRIDDKEKIRIFEISYFSPCILRALYDNEGRSAKNIGLRILQRIPFFGNIFPSS